MVTPYRADMDRRRFLLTSLVGAFAAPLAAEAQQAEGKVYRVGFLGSGPFLKALEEGLRDRGYIPRKNIIIEHRSDTGRTPRGARRSSRS